MKHKIGWTARGVVDVEADTEAEALEIVAARLDDMLAENTASAGDVSLLETWGA